MDTIVKLLVLGGIIYGVVWVSQNVDFNKVTNDIKQNIENEKTVTRVHEGRDRANQDAINVTH